jgi:RNA polymerase sigma-70 factor, ECF subfamily
MSLDAGPDLYSERRRGRHRHNQREEPMSATSQEGGVVTEFAALADPYRQELLAYCYRMLGSVHDAEDQVQETMLRAWRSYDGFEGRSSMRTWLYRIATNSCLRALETRSRRPLPSDLSEPATDPFGSLPADRPEYGWLQPFPDALVTSGTADPAAVIGARASTRLALVAALQYLPGRQRAVLILRDVLGWHAAEVADLLGISAAAVNSALQRARARLAQAGLTEDDLREPAEAADRDLIDRYAAAFETADMAALTDLLREDAALEMPPQPYWFSGRERVLRFLESRVLTTPGRFRLIVTAANGQPAFAAYMRDGDGPYLAHGIQVLTVRAGRIARVVSFNDGRLLAAFGLPDGLDSPC